MTLIDLSLPIGQGTTGVSYAQWTHERGPKILSKRARRLPGERGGARVLANYLSWLLGRRNVKPSDLPDGSFLSNEFFSMSVHTGTHIDAPFHYGPTCEGKPARKILDLPLDWLRGPGIVIDATRFGKLVSREHIAEALDRAGLMNLKGVLTLIRTDADLNIGTPAYYSDSIGVAPSAIAELLDRGSRVIGTDSWSLDPPAKTMLERYFETRDGANLWPAHMYGREREFITIEGLANLRSLPERGFDVYAFPVALRDAGAAWARVVAELSW